MCTREYLWRICIQSAIINIQPEADRAREAHILSFTSDLRIAEEEYHGDKSPEGHGSPASEEREITKIAREDRAENGTHIGKRIVSPIYGL